MKYLLFGLIVLFSFSCACSRETNSQLKYPYIASIERADQIKNNYKKVSVGQSQDDVKTVLGNPDQILPSYEPIMKNPGIIGETYWYIIQRLKENGSVNEKQEKLVIISFDFDGKVTEIDFWGLENK